jgi:hypothetical protein
MSAGQWVTFVLFCVLTVVLLAPFAPFAALYLVARNRPDLWEAYWHHPWLNGMLLSLILAAARIVFLFVLSLLPYISSAALYPATYAWYPELIASVFLADHGWNVAPSPDRLLRNYGVAFALNLAFWFGLLTLVALGKTRWVSSLTNSSQ